VGGGGCGGGGGDHLIGPIVGEQDIIRAISDFNKKVNVFKAHMP
jgi:hypothetical protein